MLFWVKFVGGVNELIYELNQRLLFIYRKIIRIVKLCSLILSFVFIIIPVKISTFNRTFHYAHL